MPTIERYQLILLIVPLVLIILAAYIFDLLPQTNYIKKFLDLMIERDLEELMMKNGLTKTSVKTFQRIRWLFALLFGTLITLLVQGGVIKRFIVAFLVIFIVYKLLYIYLLMMESSRIKKMNELLPYTIKTLAYLTYIYPASVAIKKSVAYIPKEFRYDMELLYSEIYMDPNSKKPYNNFVNRYKHKLHLLDTYLDQIYRLDQSGIKSGEKQLDTLNQKVSGEISRTRKMKNKRVNNTVAYLGFIPVVLMVIVLIYLLIALSVSSLF